MSAESIPLSIATEDPLSEAIIRVLLEQSGRNFAISIVYSEGGFGYLKRMIHGFNNAAKGTPFLVLTDLDRWECPPSLMSEWLPVHRHPNLIFRVAVREVESWLMADQRAFASYLQIPLKDVVLTPDDLADPKRELLRLVAKSPRRELRRDILPPLGSLRQQGPDYNGRLSEFVRTRWMAKEAARHSPSLARTLNKLSVFHPVQRSA